MRVVVDTNVVVSAILRDRLPEKVLLFIISQPDFEWVASICPGTRHTSCQSSRAISCNRRPANPPSAITGKQAAEFRPLAGLKQRAKFFGRVEFNVAQIFDLFRHPVGYQQAMIRGQVIALDSPLQKHLHHVAPAVPCAGRKVAVPVDVGVEVLAAQITNRVAGETFRKLAQPHGDDVVPTRRQLRAPAVICDRPQLAALHELLHCFVQFNTFDRGNVGQEAVHGF